MRALTCANVSRRGLVAWLQARVDWIQFTSPTKNPDGTDVPEWLAKRSLSSLATRGRIGLQGKHAGAPIWFRNVRIRER